ncbi:MAG: glycosyltransferase [Promethearchaeota archaeon]
MIYIKHFFRYFKNKNFNKIIKSWKKYLIPGGILKIQVYLGKNEKKVEKLKNTILKHNFFLKTIDEYDLKINGTILITAIKQRKSNSTISSISGEKLRDMCLILNQNRKYFSNIEKLCIIGFDSVKIKNFVQNLKLNINQIDCFEDIEIFSKTTENYYDAAIVANFFEYNNYSKNTKIFKELRKLLKPGGKMLILIPEKKNYYAHQVAQVFDKGILLKILDDNNIAIKWINLSSSFKFIQVLVENKNNFPLEHIGIKVLLLGVYSLRYTFLSNARWDSQVRAFKKLGYDIRILEIEDNSFSYLYKYIKLFRPDILWIGSKLAYDFLKKYADFFRGSKIKVVYWLWDIITPVEYDFRGIIDYMFITSKGEIPLYKKTYNLNKVYYVPVAIMPEIIHRNKFIKKIYDVGFAGQLGYTHPFYKERTRYFDIIRKHYTVHVFKNIYNNLSENYCQCKIVYGGTPYFKDLELYASNRPYIAMASGCVFITNYFKGLERLAENEKHLLWFNNDDELLYLLNKYINNEDLCNQIKRNAVKLIKENHNYVIRIQNMLDIIDGKTEDFYGFIK